MDYVVAGFGIGAILALAGFALWELFGNVEAPGRGWLCRTAIGLMIGALVIWSVTGVSLISTIDDSTGSRLVWLTTLVTLVAIAAGSFWYWRADRAAGAQPASTARAQRAAITEAPAYGDVELSEWDSWPERGKSAQQIAYAAAQPASAVAKFEPEVAAEVIPPAGEDIAVDTVVDVRVATVDEVEDTLAVDQPEGGELQEPEQPELQAEQPVKTPAVREQKQTRLEALPANIEQREPALEPARAPEQIDQAEPDAENIERPASSNGSNGAAGFESALLADIDADSVEGNGRYRSPLLSDLEADQLEGVGLARWRPDARLTSVDAAEPQKTQKK